MRIFTFLLLMLFIVYSCNKKLISESKDDYGTIITVKNEHKDIKIELLRDSIFYENRVINYNFDTLQNGYSSITDTITLDNGPWPSYMLRLTKNGDFIKAKSFAFHKNDRNINLNIDKDTIITITGSRFHTSKNEEVEYINRKQYKIALDSLTKRYPDNFTFQSFKTSLIFNTPAQYKDYLDFYKELDSELKQMQYFQEKKKIADIVKGHFDLYSPKDFMNFDEIAVKDTLCIYNWGVWCVNCPKSFPILDSLEKNSDIQVVSFNVWDWNAPEKSDSILGEYLNHWTQITLDSTLHMKYKNAIGQYGAPTIFFTDAMGNILSNSNEIEKKIF